MAQQNTSKTYAAERLVLFTDTYPLGTGETFLHDEVPFLARAFKKVIIFPLYHPDGNRTSTGAVPAPAILTTSSLRAGSLPANVILKPPLLPFDHKNKIRLIWNGTVQYTFTALFRYGSTAGMIARELVRKKPFLSGKKIWIFFNYLFLLRSILANRAVMREVEKELSRPVLAYFYWGDKSALAIPFLKKRLRRKNNGKTPLFAVRFHGSDLYEEAKGYLPFRETLYPAIDYAFPISRNGEQYIRNRYPHTLPARIITCRLGSPDPEEILPAALYAGSRLQPPEYEATERCADTPGRQWGTDAPEKNKSAGPLRDRAENLYHLVSCSNVIELKRVEYIARALGELADDPDALERIGLQGYTRIRWTHLGDGPLLESVKNICRTFTGRSCPPVTLEFFSPGRLPHDQIMKFYADCRPHLFVQVSRSEGIPVSIMEALSFGIPAIATRVGGTGELFDVPDHFGCLLPPSVTPGQLKETIIREICLPEEEQALRRKNARRAWEASWNARKNYEAFANLLRSLY